MVIRLDSSDDNDINFSKKPKMSKAPTVGLLGTELHSNPIIFQTSDKRPPKKIPKTLSASQQIGLLKFERDGSMTNMAGNESHMASGQISPQRFEDFKESHRELFYPDEKSKK